MELTHISLFAGIAGIDLAAEWAGFRTILFVEIDEYCQRVLKKHWPDVPIIGDIRDATKEKIMAYIKSFRAGGGQPTDRAGAGIKQRSESTEGRSQSGKHNSVTLITGGFPCQPVSQAGKRRGEADDRWLWPEMLRVISEVRPTWVVAENVAGLLRMGFNDCVSDLESEGYETISFLIPACAVNAPHRRDRIFIVAYSTGVRCYEEQDQGRIPQQEIRQASAGQSGPTGSPQDVADYEGSRLRPQFNKITDKLLFENRSSQKPKSSSGYVPDTKGKRLEGADPERPAQTRRCPAEYAGGNWWAVEPELGRVAHGIPDRVDRLKCLGNAVVPQQIYHILKAIADIERNR